ISLRKYVPCDNTSSLFVNKPIKLSADNKIIMPPTPKKTVLNNALVFTACFDLFMLSAPIFCPTIVASAVPMPIAGIKINELILLVIPNAATVDSPKDNTNIDKIVKPKASVACPTDDGIATDNSFFESIILG